MSAPRSNEKDQNLTACGARVCTGCATCVRAWASADPGTLADWQQRLVARVLPPGVTSDE